MGVHQSRPAVPVPADIYSLVAYHQDRASKLTVSQPSPLLDGWRKLPDELKVAIIQYALANATDMHINHVGDLDDQLDDYRWAEAMPLSNMVLPLVSVPDLAILAYEHFYSKNTMHITDNTLGNGNLRYPPRCLNNFVRKLDIQMALNMEKLNFLRKLGSGSMGFENLHEIAITIRGSCAEVDMDGTLLPATSNYMLITRDQGSRNQTSEKLGKLEVALENMQPIPFSTKLLTIIYEHADMSIADSLGRDTHDRLSDPWEMLLLKKFGIVGPGRVEEHYKRFESEMHMLFGVVNVCVDGWPLLQSSEEADVITEWGLDHVSRVTVKKMWAR